MPRPRFHVWRPRNQGRRRRLSGKHRVRTRDWVILAVLIMAVVVPASLWTFRAPPRHLTESEAVISRSGIRAMGTYEGLPLEIFAVGDGPDKLLLVKTQSRSGYPEVSIKALSYRPSARSSLSITFERTDTGFRSNKLVSGLSPGAVLTIEGPHNHTVTLRHRANVVAGQGVS